MQSIFYSERRCGWFVYDDTKRTIARTAVMNKSRINYSGVIDVLHWQNVIIVPACPIQLPSTPIWRTVHMMTMQH